MMQAGKEPVDDPKTQIEKGIKMAEMPCKVTWKDVSFTVMGADPNHKKKACGGVPMKKVDILKVVSGSAMPGQATYIMGSSGAGKTSLLNMISDRTSKKKGVVCKGEIKINDKT